MKVHEFLPEIWGKNLQKTAALVHVHTPEPAVANSKRDSGRAGAPESAGRSKFFKNLRQER